MAKISNNSLLGSEKSEEEKPKTKINSIKLYRKDYPQGRVYKGAETIEMMKRKGWREKLFVETVITPKGKTKTKTSKTGITVKGKVKR